MSRLGNSISMIGSEYMKDLVAVVKAEGTYNDSGDWVPGSTSNVNFKGAILPLTSRDLNQLQTTAPGIFSVDDKKLYTEYQNTFENHTEIHDGDKVYNIYVVKDYDIINPVFREYYIKKIDKANV